MRVLQGLLLWAVVGAALAQAGPGPGPAMPPPSPIVVAPAPVVGPLVPVPPRALPACVGNAQGVTTTRMQFEQAAAGNWYAVWCRTATGWVSWTIMIDPTGAIGDTLSADDMVHAIAARIAMASPTPPAPPAPPPPTPPMPPAPIGGPGGPGSKALPASAAKVRGLVVMPNGELPTRLSRYVVDGKLGNDTGQRAEVGAACDCARITLLDGKTRWCTWAGAVPNYDLVPVAVCGRP